MNAIIAARHLVPRSAAFWAIPSELRRSLGMRSGPRLSNLLTTTRPYHAATSTKSAVEKSVTTPWAQVVSLSQYESPDGLPTLVPFVDVMTTENKQALDNIAQVCGLNREWLDRQSNSIWQHLLPWEKCRRGSDLFITGLGTFNINTVYGKILQERQVDFWVDLIQKYVSEDIVAAWCRIYGIEDDNVKELVGHSEFDPHKELAAAMSRGVLVPTDETTEYNAQVQQSILEGRVGPLATPFWYVKPIDLQLMGHFGAEWAGNQTDVAVIIAQPEECPQRRHFIKFYDGWNADNEMIGNLVASLDHSPRLPSNWDSLPPERLLKYLPGPDDWFSHVDDLPDEGRLVVLRSRHHIKQVGMDLNNCIGKNEGYAYISRATDGNGVLVALYETAASTKPYALGEFNCGGRCWSQILLDENGGAPDEICDEYDKYTPTISTFLDSKD